MFEIENFAYTNNLSNHHPLEKLIFAGGLLLITLTFPPYTVSIIIFSIVFAATVFLAKVSTRIFLKVLFIPVTFIILSSLTLLIDFSAPFLSISISTLTLNLILRSIAATSCLSFLILTTPIVDLVLVIESKRSKQFIDLILLVYKFITLFFNNIKQICISQQSRLGYKNLKQSQHSLALLASNLLIKLLLESKKLSIALNSRNYSNTLTFLKKDYYFSYRNITLIIFLEIILILLRLFS